MFLPFCFSAAFHELPLCGRGILTAQVFPWNLCISLGLNPHENIWRTVPMFCCASVIIAKSTFCVKPESIFASLLSAKPRSWEPVDMVPLLSEFARNAWQPRSYCWCFSCKHSNYNTGLGQPCSSYHGVVSLTCKIMVSAMLPLKINPSEVINFYYNSERVGLIFLICEWSPTIHVLPSAARATCICTGHSPVVSPLRSLRLTLPTVPTPSLSLVLSHSVIVSLTQTEHLCFQKQ